MATEQPTADDSTDESASSRPQLINFESAIEQQMESEEEEGSHTEWNPTIFHASQIGYSEWLLLCKKLGFTDVSDLRGTFKMGELIHEYVQDALHDASVMDNSDQPFANPLPRLPRIEEPVEVTEDGLTILGHADVYDPAADVVYDIKSRSSWYNFDPPVDRHIDQLHAYMRGLDAEYGQVVYIQKKDLEVKTWPEGGPFTFDEDRWETIKARVHSVRDAILDEGIPTSEDEIPFEKPDNYFANSATLDFSSVDG